MSNLTEALMHVQALVNVMKAADPEYCAAHNWKPCDDEQWDQVLGEAEDFLEALGMPQAESVSSSAPQREAGK